MLCHRGCGHMPHEGPCYEEQSGFPGDVAVFVCGPSSTKCHCQCPDGPCEHLWDGPEHSEVSPGGGGYCTATCSRCGAEQISHDMWVMP